jgi:hypothetical protein
VGSIARSTSSTCFRAAAALALAAAAAPGAVALAGKPKARPDLVVSSVSSVPFEATGGRSIRMRDKVTNRGPGGARRSQTAYYLSFDATRDRSDRRLAARPVPSLERGRRSSGVAQVVMPTNTAGLFRIIACADDQRRIRESNERNNCRAAPGEVTIRPPERTQSSA